MADLKSIFAKKANANAEAATTQPNADDTARTQDSGAQSGSTDGLPSTSQTPAATPPATRNPFGNRDGSKPADENVGADRPSVATTSNESSQADQPKPKLASLSGLSRTRPSDSDSSEVASRPLDSLDALDSSTDEGVAPRSGMSSFADETPATKPTRELPADLKKEELQFIDLIDGVYEVLHEPDLLGGVIRNIMIELKSHDEYMRLVAPDDIRTWVKGMRESMGLARIKKTETKAKRAGGSGKKSKLVDDDMLADLDSLGISLD